MVKKLLILFFCSPILMGGGCEIQYCPGIFEEPTFAVASDTLFSVWYHNQALKGDTMQATKQPSRGIYDSAYVALLPLDMNDTAMSYHFLQNDTNKGELIYTYKISSSYCSGYKANKYILNLSSTGIDSSSTFLNLYSEYGYGTRIDSILNSPIPGYYGGTSEWWVVF